MKVCKICNFTGDASFFEKHRKICKVCWSLYQRQYREKNKETIVLQQKDWRQNNIEELKSSRKQYYETNKNSILEQQKNYYQNNKEIIKVNNKNYRSNHKKERNAREKERRDTDPSYKLRVYLSRDIFRSVKSKNGLSTFKILPYSVDDLRTHLEQQFESWMSWDNYGAYVSDTWVDDDQTTWTWQIDHIIPRSHFNYTNINDADFIKCWSLSNLRPLSSKANLINGSKLDRRTK